MNPLISVIVPVYNVEKYLDRCVESIVNQTYKNLEIILVDDGSPDNSGALCDEWAKKDTRIRVFHKENGGLSDARNAGTDYAEGDFITFVDSDDYILPQYVECLYNNLIATNSDVSCCDFKEIYDEGLNTTFENTSESYDIKIISGRDACFKLSDYSVSVYYVITPCKLYKSNLIKLHKFPKGLLHEDEATTYKIFFDSQNICISPQKLYAYYQNPTSIMHNKTQKNYIDLFFIFKSKAEFFQEKGDYELENDSWDYLFSFLIYSHFEFKKRFDKKVLKFAAKYIATCKISLKTKFKFLVYYASPKLYEKIVIFLSKG